MFAGYLRWQVLSEDRARREKEEAMRKSTKFVALEQHVDSITVALAYPGRRLPELYGDIPATGRTDQNGPTRCGDPGSAASLG